ncbi:DNA-processing protein DprA [Limnobacter sp.]|uniref:DNA-processing protein DprA n=1 Tax=Limnobacter sp. TaxID=2003368 RepID=UPI003519A5DC
MYPLLHAMNLAYNTHLPAAQRQTLAAKGPQAELPAPCDAVRIWHSLARDWLEEAPRRFWRTVHSPDYPPGLLQLKNPPLILFGEGEAALLGARSIGVVGSRSATRTGLANAQAFASAMATQGWAIVSGLAEGIDGAAHHGALEAHGATVAVLGCGPDVVFPAHHSGLVRRIVGQGGLVLSEYPPGTAPQKAFFPRRNRIIAALSDGLLVVEAALRSGSLITARYASELGRAVGAVPGSIHNTHSKGCHAMIKQGALLVETAQDLLNEVQASLPTHRKACPPLLQEGHNLGLQHLAPGGDPAEEPGCELSDDLAHVLGQVGHHPEHIDRLAGLAGIACDQAFVALTELELMGLVVAEPGNRWVLSGQPC